MISSGYDDTLVYSSIPKLLVLYDSDLPPMASVVFGNGGVHVMKVGKSTIISTGTFPPTGAHMTFRTLCIDAC